jgi:DNA-binding response OmpR family regulator
MMGRILVADDDPMITSLVSALLRRHGHQVKVAHDGQQALELLSAFEADLVITDIVMPCRGGLDLIPELRADRPGLPIVAISGVRARDGEVDGLEAARSLGANGTMRKPLDRKALVEMVSSLLSDDRTASS